MFATGLLFVAIGFFGLIGPIGTLGFIVLPLAGLYGGIAGKDLGTVSLIVMIGIANAVILWAGWKTAGKGLQLLGKYDDSRAG